MTWGSDSVSLIQSSRSAFLTYSKVIQMLLVLGQALSSKGVWTQHTIVLDMSLNLGSIVFIIKEKLGKISFQCGSFYF